MFASVKIRGKYIFTRKISCRDCLVTFIISARKKIEQNSTWREKYTDCIKSMEKRGKKAICPLKISLFYSM